MIARDTGRTSVEDTRGRIFAAAREIFALKGPHGTTTREIADRAGVNEATLFRHFGNKSALLEAMKEYFCQSAQARLDVLFAGLSGDLESDLQSIATWMVEGMSANKDLIRVSLLEEVANPGAPQAPFRTPILVREHLTRFLQKHVMSGELQGEAEILARFFMGMFFSYIMARAFGTKEILSEDDAVKTYVNIFLNGVRSTKW